MPKSHKAAPQPGVTLEELRGELAAQLADIFSRTLADASLGEQIKSDPIEPVFVLRAKDLLAPDMVDAWCDRLEKIQCGRVDGNKVAQARAIALRMRAWQAEFGCHIPD